MYHIYICVIPSPVHMIAMIWFHPYIHYGFWKRFFGEINGRRCFLVAPSTSYLEAKAFWKNGGSPVITIINTKPWIATTGWYSPEESASLSLGQKGSADSLSHVGKNRRHRGTTMIWCEQNMAWPGIERERFGYNVIYNQENGREPWMVWISWYKQQQWGCFTTTKQ